MEDNIFTIYIKQKDFNFVENEIGIIGRFDFNIESSGNNNYKIIMSERELEAMADFIVHSCDFIESDRKATRLDNIALMLENYLDQL
jgi:hypothetical protein